jgi:hypothetical protein
MTLFWTVWGIGQGTPRYRHETPEGARGEARRLASIHHDTAFQVLECRAVGAPERWREPVPEEAPADAPAQVPEGGALVDGSAPPEA